MSGAASSSTMPRLQVLPQKSVNQRPTVALLSSSFDMMVLLLSCRLAERCKRLCLSKFSLIVCADHSVSWSNIKVSNGPVACDMRSGAGLGWPIGIPSRHASPFSGVGESLRNGVDSVVHLLRFRSQLTL